MDFGELTELTLGHCVEAFGEAVTHTPQVGAAQEFRGIYSGQYVDAENVTSDQPNLGVRLSDMNAHPKQGDQITIGTTNYRVRDVQIDGEGGATLFLHEL